MFTKVARPGTNELVNVIESCSSAGTKLNVTLPPGGVRLPKRMSLKICKLILRFGSRSERVWDLRTNIAGRQKAELLGKNDILGNAKQVRRLPVQRSYLKRHTPHFFFPHLFRVF